MKVFDEFQKVNDEISSVDVPESHFSSPGDVIEKLRPWKGVLIAVLTFIKIFTGKRADEKINQLISGINMFL